MRTRPLALLVLGLLPSAACERAAAPPPGLDASLDVATALAGSGSAEGFARADGPRAFFFPIDHGPHDGFRTEWWYVTGNLAAADGRAFGFQLTFFRNALEPEGGAPSGDSNWRTNHVWMAHLAISDERGRRFRFAERFAREALDLASAKPGLDVHLRDWRLVGADGGFPARLVATEETAEGAMALDLELDASRPPVLQGDAGLSRKGTEPGNASYYYSMTRLETRGELTIDGERFAVDGLSWLDREWSTSALGPELIGWDWFALQFDDGRDLMFYRLRRRDGSSDALSAGSIVDPNGSTMKLSIQDVVIEPVSWFESADGVARYPSRWRLRVPSQNIDVTLTPRVDDQELRVTVRYWEGAVRIEGAIGGSGFVEMTGYRRR
jgi:predicted secreted hydrolase